MRARKSNRRLERLYCDIGLERIGILFGLAETEAGKRPDRAKRYVTLARKIAMRHNIRMPASLKRKFCRKCSSFFLPGTNCTVRTRASQQAVIIKCLACNNIIRYPYRREK